MRHCFNESVSVHEASGENLEHLLLETANLVGRHDGWARVVTEAGADPDTGLFSYTVTSYLHA